MRWRDRFLLLLGVAAASAAAASECIGPQLSRSRLQEIAQDIGDVSYQMTPSTVLLRTTFRAPGQPPEIDVLFSGGDKRYIKAVIHEAALLRSGCASAEAPAQSFQFARVSVYSKGLMTGGQTRYEPEPRLKQDLKLTELLPLVQDLKQQHVRFDFQTMGCPFTLAFAPMRPYVENVVVELDTARPERREFVAWLRGITLMIPETMMVTAIGRRSVLTVPCAVLDLT